MINLFGAGFVGIALLFGGYCSLLYSAEPTDSQKHTPSGLTEEEKQRAEIERLQRQYEEAKAVAGKTADKWRANASADREAQIRAEYFFNREVVEELSKQLEQMKRQLGQRESQLAGMAEQLKHQHRPRDLPPLEGAQVKLYPLKYAKAREAAKTIESLFGTQAMRLAVDEQSNALVVYGKPDALAALDTLVKNLDSKAAPQGEAAKKGAGAAPRTLVMRLFWLADGLPKNEGQLPEDFLPYSVLEAMEKLGVREPRLVTQTVNSLAIGGEAPAQFTTRVPAVVKKQPAELECQGTVGLGPDERVRMDMRVHVAGAINCDVSGSLITPLGHYMVLGTANSVVGVMSSFAGGGAFRPTPGGAEPGPGPEGGPRPAGPEPGPDPSVNPAEPQFSTSRFAFVVQVVEGESFPAEAPNTQAPPPRSNHTKSQDRPDDDPFRK